MFVKPRILFICADCGRAHSESDLDLKPVFKYVVNEEAARNLAMVGPNLSELSDRLREEGYLVESPCKLVGTSGGDS